MPQFDFFSFSSQTFWVILSFGFIYFLLLAKIIVPLSESIKFRKKLLIFCASKVTSKVSFSKKFVTLIPFITHYKFY